MKEKSISQKQISKKKASLESWNHGLWHRPTRPILSGYNANIWQDVEIKVDPDPFYTSYQISMINKKARSKIPSKSKKPSKWLFMDITPGTTSKTLTKDTTYSNYIFIVNAYFRILKCIKWKISPLRKSWTNLMCFRKYLKSRWTCLVGYEIIQTDDGTHFTSK